MSFRDERRYAEAEAYHRVPPPEFSAEALAAQRAEFEARGGKIVALPDCAVSELTNHSLHAQTSRQAKAALGER